MSKHSRHFNHSRKIKMRDPRKRIYVLCEGKTEEGYFESFRRRGLNLRLEVQTAKHTDPDSMLQSAKQIISKEELESGFDEMWCVFDLDVLATDEQWRLIYSSASKHHVRLAYSNPCFELWYYLHFTYVSKKLDSRTVLSMLRTYLPDYEKNKDVAKAIRQQLSKAIANAKQLSEYHNQKKMERRWTRRNPETAVHELVQRLLLMD